MSGQFLLHVEIDQVAMVRPYVQHIEAAFQIVPEGFESSYNREELFVMNFIITLRRLEGLGKICDRMPTVQGIGLFKDSAGSEITSVCD